jgi:MFS family permease
VSWAQALALRDATAFATIFHTPTLRYAAFGFALLAFTGYGIGFWVPPYFVRMRGVGEAEAGLILGGGAAVAGWVGVTIGGVWSDRWRHRRAAARLYVGIAAALLPLPLVVGMLSFDSIAVAFALAVIANAGVSLWIGPGASTVQDLIAPRLRATASAAYLLVITFIGLALGPYTIGRLSVALGDLRTAMLVSLVANPIAVVLLLLAARHLSADEARAKRAG